MPTPVRLRKNSDEERKEQWILAFQPNWPYVTIGFGSEKDYLIENISLLVAAGVGVSGALSSIEPTIQNFKLRRAVKNMREMVEAGSPFWKAVLATGWLSARAAALIKSGEQSGKLPEHLNLVTVQQHKEKLFSSRIRSALLYPGIVLVLAVVVSVISAWVTLPRFVSVLEIGSNLPFFTQVIISFGNLLRDYGVFVVPAFLFSFFILVYLIFFYKTTKFIGEWILLHLPGVNKLVQGVEVARFGFVFGALLNAGLPISECFDALKEGTGFRSYRKFYEFMERQMLTGAPIKQIFANYPKSRILIPLPIQQLIGIAGNSGKLPETLMRVGLAFEEKTDSMSKDLSTILEPIVLIVVGIIVAFIVLGIVSPIYNLAGNIGV